jgi:hypothetical protein
VTLPTPDAQSSQPLSAHSHQAFAAHSIPAGLPLPTTPPFASTPLPLAETASAYPAAHTQVSASADFAHSWDLATGGFKTLTAKRELPPLQQRRGQATSLPEPAPARSYMFLLVILACVVVMLVSGGVVLFMTLQP